MNNPKGGSSGREETMIWGSRIWLVALLAISRRIQTNLTTTCWELPVGKGNKYPYVRLGQRKWRANRLSYVIHYGHIPAHLQVCHHCDNPACVHPAHLFLGTQSDNTRDAVNKGRQKYPDCRGEKCNFSKLTKLEVLEIRKLADRHGLPQTQIAARFGITQQQVAKIKQRITWKHLVEKS